MKKLLILLFLAPLWAFCQTLPITGPIQNSLYKDALNGYYLYNGSTVLGQLFNGSSTISLTTSGNNGSSTLISGVLNVPTYTLAGLGGISLTSLSATSPLLYNNTTGVFSIQQSNTSQSGFLSSTDWNTFNGKQGAITLTTTGSSGAATFSGDTLNIPQYTGTGTVTSVGLSLPTSVFTLSGTPVTGSGTLTGSFATQTANYFFAAPNGSNGTPLFRAIVAADIPTLNQNTTGTAANITATSNSTLTTLSALVLPYSQLSGAPSLSGYAPIASPTFTGTVTIPNGGVFGTPASVTLTNGTGLPLTSGVTGSLSVANGGTGTASPGLVAGTNVTITGTWPDQTINSSGSASGPTYYGYIFNATTFANTSAFTTNGATVSATGGMLQFSGGANTYTQTLDYTYSTALEKWTQSLSFIVPTITSSTYGVGLSIRSTNTGGNYYNVQARVSCASGTLGALTVLGGNTYTSLLAVATGASNLPLVAGDTVIMTLSRNQGILTATAYDHTQQSVQVTATTTYTPVYGATFAVPNTGRFGISSYGGTVNVLAYSIYSNEIENATIMFVGDSKTVGYYASSFLTRFASIVGQQFNVNVCAGSADQTADVLLHIPEIIALHPKYVVLEIGCNDIRASVPETTIQTNYASIVSQLTTAGITVYNLLPIYEDTGIDQYALLTWIKSTYPSNYIDSKSFAYSAVPSLILAPDNEHPNTLLHNIIGNAIIASGFFTSASVAPLLNQSNGYIFSTNQTVNIPGIGATLPTPTDGYTLQNTTLSTATTTAQDPPDLKFTGHAWNTTATAADNQIDVFMSVAPTSGASPGYDLGWYGRISTAGTGSYSTLMFLTNAGNLNVEGTLTTNSTLNCQSLYGSGNMYGFNLISGTTAIEQGANTTLRLGLSQAFSAAGTSVSVVPGTYTGSSGTYNAFSVVQTYNETATASDNDILVNRTNTALGSGTHYIFNGENSSTSVWALDYHGKINVPTSGGAQTAGSATLAAGTATVSTSIVDANSIILLSSKTAGGVVGTLSYTISAGTSFTINSSVTTDTSTIGYLIIN